MYPLIRLAWHSLRARKMPTLPLGGTHVSHHYCMPWDLDPWWELNNGRTLTLYDLGRIPLATRTGLVGMLRRHRWGLTVAGVSMRYRKRITMFMRFEMRSRLIGMDDRFIYLDQSMWKDGTCLGQGLYRGAVIRKGGMLPTAELRAAMLDELGEDTAIPTLPDWVRAWIAAEAERPWPPESTLGAGS
ncbi:thioeseterase [Roseovarius sp. 22II1-1F6A]|nr:thioeseterase [Roseovarius sp. 22II1-1F6A]